MFNKIIFAGFLGKDPEVRYTPSGVAICNFSVASTEKWKDKNTGEPMERTEWLRCTAFDRLAEICGEYLEKGYPVLVEGQLQTRKYDKDGVTHYATECRLSSMKMLPRPDRGAQDGDRRPAATTPARPAAARDGGAPGPRAVDSSTGFDDMPDDVPFIVSLNDYSVASSKARRLRRAR